MRVLVTYASQMGATRGIAERIAAALGREGIDAAVEAVDRAPEPAGFDTFVIGSAVHAGHWLPEASAFVRGHRDVLAEHPVWLFSSGPVGDRAVAAPQPDPRELGEFRPQIHPRDHRVFGGAFDATTADLRSLGLVVRTLIKRFMPSGDWRDWEAIESWAVSIAGALRPDPASGAA